MVTRDGLFGIKGTSLKNYYTSLLKQCIAESMWSQNRFDCMFSYRFTIRKTCMYKLANKQTEFFFSKS